MIITPIEKHQSEQAKNVILSGFLERFGFIDHSLNPDIHDISLEYDGNEHHFFVGREKDEIICTGAIRRESEHTYQIVRMSVLSPYRKCGLGRIMLQHLEEKAYSLGARRLILETNKRWADAIRFYQNNGFTYMEEDEVSCYFEKEIPL
ncbi:MULTISPECIES: GNAT family N-acetyltransferase [Bacillaceae]|uniref:GNAT family N-acetyltransferase n=1 Tax=Bacillaceae TaxID=186817 RepID=UPI001C5933CE|nr:GNAT family N-acetyltransferase [Rossellomorea sp. YZS02]MBW3112717.1 GNAT family N-acetyltransferase [Bacillus sp. MCCB 382]MDX8342695.1 GNAT family N-acetyltransferase [Rossellomorea sp. YZS02]